MSDDISFDADGLKVLVADDSSAIRLAFNRACSQSPVPLDVTEARDGTEFAEKFRTNAFDMAFIDVIMPGMSGTDALAQCRAEGVHTFSVLMSTNVTNEVMQLAKKLRAYEFLRKPFTPSDLANIVSNYLRLRQGIGALIVDDSSIVRRVVGKVLESSHFGFRISQAGDGESALALHKQKGADIVFLDINMPGLDGIETLKRLKNENEAARVVLMSAEHSEEKLNAATEAGADGFLKKPFYPADVDAILHRLLGLNPPYLNTAA